MGHYEGGRGCGEGGEVVLGRGRGWRGLWLRLEALKG